MTSLSKSAFVFLTIPGPGNFYGLAEKYRLYPIKIRFTNVPALTNAARWPSNCKCSLRKTADKITGKTTLNLSTGATGATFPICRGLKIKYPG